MVILSIAIFLGILFLSKDISECRLLIELSLSEVKKAVRQRCVPRERGEEGGVLWKRWEEQNPKTSWQSQSPEERGWSQKTIGGSKGGGVIPLM